VSSKKIDFSTHSSYSFRLHLQKIDLISIKSREMATTINLIFVASSLSNEMMSGLNPLFSRFCKLAVDSGLTEIKSYLETTLDLLKMVKNSLF